MDELAPTAPPLSYASYDELRGMFMRDINLSFAEIEALLSTVRIHPLTLERTLTVNGNAVYSLLISADGALLMLKELMVRIGSVLRAHVDVHGILSNIVRMCDMFLSATSTVAGDRIYADLLHYLGRTYRGLRVDVSAI